MSRPWIAAAAALLLCLACTHENPVQPPPVPPPPVPPPPPPHINHRPVAHIRGYTSGFEGSGTFFAADSSADPDGDSLRVTWLSGDGRRSEGCIDATAPGYAGFDSDCVVFWTYPDDGTYLVSVIVADDSGAADTASMAITIRNWPPSLRWVRVPGYQEVRSRDSIAFIIEDRGTADTHTIAVEWGDGTSETVAAVDTGVGDCVTCFGPVSAPEILSHTYATVGTYSIAVTVHDDDGGDSTSVTPFPVVVFNPNARQTVAGYEVMDLGTLGAYSARPADFNNRRQVVGTSMTASGAPHAFLWDETGMHDLGTLGHEGSEAVRINNEGVIAGTVWTRVYGNEDDGLFARNIGTIWKNGVGVALDGQTFTTRFSQPANYPRLFDQPPRIVRAINASGEIAWAQYTEWRGSGWLWNGSWQSLGAYPMALNDRGQVVGGMSFNDGEIFHASLWEGDSSRELAALAPQACAYSGDCSVSVPMDINADGRVVGVSTDAARQFHFVLWEDDKIKDLGSATWAYPQSAPRIFNNDRGDIVGSVAGTAFFWNEDGKITLPSAGGLVDIVGMNENGEVAGTISTGTTQHAFVWSQARGLVDLGTGPPGFGAAWVVDINARGDIVGYSAPCRLDSRNRCADSPIALKDPGWGVLGATQVRAILWRNMQATASR